MAVPERFAFGPLQERLLERGELPYLVLDTLAERPRHGYEIIRALRERFGGIYVPSAGAIYPTLRRLEAQGYVRASRQVGKTVYALLEAGRRLLAQQRHRIEAIRARAGSRARIELHDELLGVQRELQHIGRLFRYLRTRRAENVTTLRRVRAVVAGAGREIEAILAEERQSQVISPG